MYLLMGKFIGLFLQKKIMISLDPFSVDMEEHFEVISLPDALTEISFLINFNGCLSLVAVDDKDIPVVIWIVKNENEFVWEKKCCADIPYGGMMEDLHSVGAREHDIFFITAHHYIILDTDDSSWCLIDFDVCEPNAQAVFPYTQSLLPCSGHFARKENDQREAGFWFWSFCFISSSLMSLEC